MGKGHCPGASDGTGVRADVAPPCVCAEVLVGAISVVVEVVEVEERSDVIAVAIVVDIVDDASPLPGLGRGGMTGMTTPEPPLFDMARPMSESVCLGVPTSSKASVERVAKAILAAPCLKVLDRTSLGHMK